MLKQRYVWGLWLKTRHYGDGFLQTNLDMAGSMGSLGYTRDLVETKAEVEAVLRPKLRTMADIVSARPKRVLVPADFKVQSQKREYDNGIKVGQR